MKYYKIIHKETGTLMCYVSGNSDDSANDICEILGLNDYTFEEINKEEYERETEDTEEGAK